MQLGGGTVEEKRQKKDIGERKDTGCGEHYGTSIEHKNVKTVLTNVTQSIHTQTIASISHCKNN